MKWIGFVVLITLFWQSPIYGQPPQVDAQLTEAEAKITPDEFRDVASDLRCPTCTGLSVLDSDAPFSVQIKNEVKQQLAAGKDKSEILSFFTDRYGPWILREPPKQGINLWAWIIPAGMLLLGPVLIWCFVWNRRHGSETIDHENEFEPRRIEEIVSEMNRKIEDLRRKNG